MDEKDKSVVAVIVTHNRLQLLKECIFALSNSSVLCDVIIVNNASADGTKEYLDTLDKQYNMIKFYIYNSDINMNGAGGYNHGIRIASKLRYKYIWLMDDDCIVHNDSLYELLNVADSLNDNFGFLSSKVIWKDGSICKTNIQRKSVARRIHDFDSELVNVDFSSFVSCFFKREDINIVGLPIKEFIIWTDDLEWTRRLTFKKINKHAKPGYLCNKSVATHKCANNFGVTIVRDTPDRLERYKFIYRNDVVCFRREGIRGHIYMFVRNLYHILRIMFLSSDKRFLRIKYLLNGYIDGYRFNPKIEYV